MPSITGAQDHTPFGSLMAQLVYGRRPDGSLVSIADVPSGRDCDCVCPACGVPLIAQKGDVNVHHFRHDGAEAGCGKGGETSAHIWAKLTLEKHLKLWLPAATYRLDGKTITVRPARLMTFAKAELEQRDGDIVPDVVVTTSSGRRLLVEIHVTHKCDAAKKAILARQGTAAIEVDLSPLRTCQDQDVVAAYLIGLDARAAHTRHWLYSPAIETARDAAIAARDEAAAAQKAAEARAAQEKRNATRAFLRDLAELPVGETSDSDMAAVRRHGALDLLEPGDEVLPGFTVPARHWRARILNRPVLRQMEVQWGGQRAFDLREAIEAVARYIHPELRYPTEARKREIQDVAPGFVFPRGQVADYIERLLAMNILERAPWSDSFQLSPSGVTRLAQGKGRIDRRDRARQLVHRIVTAIPAAERAGFDLEAWLAAPVPGHDDRLEVLAEAGDRAWIDIERTLVAIETMQRGGAAEATDFGLPLAPTLQRTRDREAAADAAKAAAQQQAAKAAADRRHRAIVALADQLVGLGPAHAWLATPAEPGKVSHLAWAEHSDDGYHAVETRLRAHAAEIEAQRQCDRQAAEARKTLEAKAMEAWEPAQARWWLDHVDHRLGAVPMTYCVDAATLQHCLAYIPVARTTRRRRG